MELLLLKVMEVVEQLNISRARVYEMMASGELPSVRVGGSRRVRSADLRAFVVSLDDDWRPRR